MVESARFSKLRIVAALLADVASGIWMARTTEAARRALRI
jgi:hypothetical protein